TYWAVVEGGPEGDEGKIELSLGRLDATRGWWMKPDAKGLPAVTRWRVLGRANPSPASKSDVSDLDQSSTAELGNTRGRRGGSPRGGGVRAGQSTPPGASGATLPLQGRDQRLTWLALEPVTGRTHQLRVHCAEMGWPIVAMRSTATRRATAGR